MSAGVGVGRTRPWTRPTGAQVAERLLHLPRDRWQLRRRAVRDGLLVAGLLASAFVLTVIPAIGRSLGYDAFAYWSIDLHSMYARTMESQYALGGFRYAPPIGLLGAWLNQVPWELFLWAWLALMGGALVYLGGSWTIALLALPPVALELEQGNVHLLIAVAIVMGFRWPWTWSFVLLTKVTPGIGLVWFAVRREWRALAIATGFTIAVCAVAYVLAPGLWGEWIRALTVNAEQTQDYSIPPPLVFRLPIAVTLVAWGARTDRPWTVGVAAMLALPILWLHGLVVALAAVPFLRSRARRRRMADPAATAAGFIPLHVLFGRDAMASRASGAPSPWPAVAAMGGALALAALTFLVAGPLIGEVLASASAYIHGPGG